MRRIGAIDLIESGAFGGATSLKAARFHAQFEKHSDVPVFAQSPELPK
jgi:hypothetical protein